MRRVLVLIALVAALAAQNLAAKEEGKMNEITISVGGKSFVATLADTEAAREFAQILPFELDMREFGAKEKTADLERKFSGRRQAPGRIEAGELMIYGQNTLVLFHKSFEENFYTYVKIAKIRDASGLKEALGDDGVRVKFERAGR